MYSQKASNKYDQLRWKTMSGREVEGEVLLKAALLFRRAQPTLDGKILTKEAEEALDFNRRIWDVLRRGWSAEDCALPIEVRRNLLNLAVFMYKADMGFRTSPEASKLNGMIQVNETLAGGLGANASKDASVSASS
jgi:flagellar protein FlaF